MGPACTLTDACSVRVSLVLESFESPTTTLGFGLPGATGKPFVQASWSAKIPTGQYRDWDGTLYMLALLRGPGTFRLWY